MADIYGPFDTAAWSQDQWMAHIGAALPSGVHGSPAASVSAGDLPLGLSGLNWTVGVGKAFVRGAGFSRDAAAGGAATANTHGTWFRRDRIVVRRDVAAKTVTVVRLTGTPAATPVAPAIASTPTGQYDLPLFSFLVPPNSGTAISGVIDERVFLDPDNGGLAIISGALSLASNYSAATVWGPPKWVRRGDEMRLQGTVTNSVTSYVANAGQEYQIGTLPAGTEPGETKAFAVAYGNGSAFAGAMIIVRSDGQVRFISYTNVNIGSIGQLSLSLAGIDWTVGL